jgi:hypothetical protein
MVVGDKEKRGKDNTRQKNKRQKKAGVKTQNHEEYSTEKVV